MQTDEFIGKVKTLVQMYSDGLLGGETMPEDALMDVVSRRELPNVLTLGMALNYQRNAYALWESIARTYQDADCHSVFEPKIAARMGLDALREALTRHRVALQPNRHPVIWQRVAGGIACSSSRQDVIGLIESAEFDVALLSNMVQKTRKSMFPYLSGPKIFNYWLYVMERYAGIPWKNRELITIAPDTHILKATVRLGLCSAHVLNGSEHDRQIVSEAWEKALQGTGLAPIDIHTPLWLWSRSGFIPLA